jgi:hypothetical protein
MKIKFVSKHDGKILHENYDEHEKIECPICNREIHPYWESRYSGIRGKCDLCGINWAES